MSSPDVPTNVTRIVVAGYFTDSNDVATAGKLVVTPDFTRGINDAWRRIVMAAPTSMEPSASTGLAYVSVVAGDDPDLNPSNFTHTVSEPGGRKYQIFVFQDTPVWTAGTPGHPLDGQRVLWLNSVAPSDAASSGVVQVVAGPQGPPGEVSAAQMAAAVAAAKLADRPDLDTTGAAVGGVPTATQISGGIPTQWKVLRPSAPTPQLHGAVGDGVADDTAALNAWAAAGYNEGYIPPGTYLTSTGVVQPATMSVTLSGRTTIRASAAMTTLWSTDTSGTDVQDKRLDGGLFDCNNLADTGVRVYFAHRFWLARTRIVNSKLYGLVIGDPAAPQVTGQVFLNNIDITRGSSDAAPTGSIGIWVRRAYDCHVNIANIVGSKTGIRADVGANYFTECHSWGYANSLPDVCFDDNADENYWLGCMADSPTVYGFRLRQFRSYLDGNHCYANSTLSTDNTIIGIFFDKTAPDATMFGTFFEGDNGTHRLAKDAECSTPSSSWKHYITAAGNRWENVVAQNLPRHLFQQTARFTGNSNGGAAEFAGDHAALMLAEKYDGTDVFRVNTATGRVEFPNGQDVRGYSDAYSTTMWRLHAGNGGVTPGRYTTAGRPTPSAAGTGAMIFDTTLNKPIWSDNTNWRDASGALV